MNNKMIGFAVVVVLLVGAFLLMPKGSQVPSATPDTSSQAAAPAANGDTMGSTMNNSAAPSETGSASVNVSGSVSVGTQSAAVAATIKGYAFAPATLKVKKGTTVTWTNMDNVSHSVVADSGKWESDLLGNGKMYSHTFDTVGTFAYHCGPHPYMKGTVEVTQ